MNRPHSKGWRIDGSPVRGTLLAVWFELDFSKAWVDDGPSPAGNPGPYLKVPRKFDGEDFVHRVYPTSKEAHALVVALRERGAAAQPEGQDASNPKAVPAGNQVIAPEDR